MSITDGLYNPNLISCSNTACEARRRETYPPQPSPGGGLPGGTGRGQTMPYAPPSRCTDPECHDLATKGSRCDEHQPIPWRGRDNKHERYGISSGEWRTLKRKITKRDNGCCYICGAEPVDPDTYDEDARSTYPHELDHVIPISEGGARRSLDNLGLACTTCHDTKSKAEAQRANARRRKAR